MKHVWNLLAHNRDYRLLLGGNLISSSGDWVLGIGMMYYVFTVTGSALASGTILVVSVLPQLLFGSIGGVFADRWDRRRTMIVVNVLLAVALTPLFLVHDKSQIWIIYVAVFLEASLEQFIDPAESAMVPHVVPEEDLVSANALNGQNRQVSRLIGSAIGGVLAATGGIFLVATFDVVSYLAAAGLTMMIKYRAPAAEPAEPGREAERPESVLRQWADGIKLCVGKAELRTLLIYRMFSFFGEGVFAALLAPYIISELGANSVQYGSIISVQAIGGIAGGLTIAALGRRGKPLTLLGYGALFFGVFDLLIVVYPLALDTLWPVFVFIALVGLPAASLVAGYTTLQQTMSTDAYRGRVFGAISTAAGVTMLLGAVLGGILSDRFGIIPVIAVQGVIHIFAGPIVLVRLRRYAAAEAVPDVEPLVDPTEMLAQPSRDLVGDS